MRAVNNEPITNEDSDFMKADRAKSPSIKAASSQRRVRVPRTPTFYKPWLACIIGIDPSTVAHGYSMFIEGEYCLSGSLDDPRTFAHDVHNVFNLVNRRSYNQRYRRLVFVSEDWGGSVVALKALCAERMRWKHSMELSISYANWATVNTTTWAAAYGIHRMKSKDRKARAILLAEQIKKASVKDDNEADAILIGSFACYWDGLKDLGLERCT